MTHLARAELAALGWGCWGSLLGSRRCSGAAWPPHPSNPQPRGCSGGEGSPAAAEALLSNPQAESLRWRGVKASCKCSPFKNPFHFQISKATKSFGWGEFESFSQLFLIKHFQIFLELHHQPGLCFQGIFFPSCFSSPALSDLKLE